MKEVTITFTADEFVELAKQLYIAFPPGSCLTNHSFTFLKKQTITLPFQFSNITVHLIFQQDIYAQS